LFNFRIVLTPTDDATCYVRHWCYSGNDTTAFIVVMLAAYAWDGSLNSEPLGWNKNGQTGEWRAPA
jgi:hypothetical protein